jgi:dihydroorotase
VAAPGLVDLNVALREPGYSRKGNIASETRAAAAGGVTSLCCPPQTKPVLDTSAVAELILDRAREAGNTKVFPIGALSKGLDGEQLAELVALRDAGCVAFGNGLESFRNTRTLCRALEYAATFDLTVIFNSQDHDLAEGGLAHEGAVASFLGLPGIPETAETVALARDLLLVEQSGVRAHFSQLTSARGVALIAQAQARGLPVTADVALYQLILTDEALIDFSSLYHVQPPLRTRADRDGLRAAVKSGVVSAISSHHQPHERDAKLAPFGATEPGISSVELLLPLAMTLVEDGLLDLPTLLARLSAGPAEALRLPAGKLAVVVRRISCCSTRLHRGRRNLAVQGRELPVHRPACRAWCATPWWTDGSATRRNCCHPDGCAAARSRDFSSSGLVPLAPMVVCHRLLKGAAILRVAHRNLIIQRPEVIQHPHEEQTAGQQVDQPADPFALVHPVHAEHPRNVSRIHATLYSIGPAVKRRSASRSMDGIRNRSISQPIPSKPKVKNQIVPVTGLP